MWDIKNYNEELGEIIWGELDEVLAVGLGIQLRNTGDNMYPVGQNEHLPFNNIWLAGHMHYVLVLSISIPDEH